MSGVSRYIGEGIDYAVGAADDLSNALDFGSNAPPNGTVKPKNPEKDLSEIDRANPVNVEYSTFGLPPVVFYGGVAIAALIALKAFKVI